MKSLTDSFVLNNGVEIPCIGFGTWQTPDGDVCVASVKAALDAGYRHIDTAAAYENESGVGKGIKDSGIAREEIFVTSKLQNIDHGYDKTMAAFEKTLKELETDYLDMYLIHWPNPIHFRDCWERENAGSWKAMEELYEAKRIRAIGVSNFLQHHLDALMKTANVKPAVNQIHLCPGDTQSELVQYCRDRDILLEAYSPLGVGKVFSVPEVKEMAGRYGRSIAQLCIRWSLQMGFLPLPKSVTASRIAENAQVFDFDITDEDVKILAAMDGVAGVFQDPDTAPW